MAFTAQLGTTSSQLGNLEPGQGAVEAPFQRGGQGAAVVPAAPAVAFAAPTFTGSGTTDPSRYNLVQHLGLKTSASASFASPVTPGNLIVVFGDPTTCSDNQGNTYTRAETVGSTAAIWYAWNVAASGTFTISVTQVGLGWSAHEWSGFGTVDPLAGHAHNNNTSGPSYTVTSSNRTPTDHMGISYLVHVGGTIGAHIVSTTATSPPWTTEFANGDFNDTGLYRRFNATDDQSITVTMGGVATWAASYAYFVNPQDSVGATVGTSAVSGTGLAVFEGGDILLETGDKIILEDGSGFLLLESTSVGASTSADGSSTVTGVSGTVITAVATAAGVSTPHVVGIGIQHLVTGTGSVTFGPPGLNSGFQGLTQEGRFVLYDETGTSLRLTQLAKQTAWNESGPLPQLRLTQMAREVLYTYQCASPGPDEEIGLLDTPIVHITNLNPIWELERFDLKKRGEETASAEGQSNTNPPSWHDDGISWQLLRFDLRPRIEGTTAATPLITNTNYILTETGDPLRAEDGTPIAMERTETQWRLERFDIHNRDEETA